jgi:pilus assembly protein Flp/PilA
MTGLQRQIVAFMADESGQDLIEYALVGALVFLAAVATTAALGTTIGSIINNIGTTFTTNV